MVYNFTVNRRFTFRSVENYAGGMLRVLGYYLAFTPLSTWWGAGLTALGVNEYVVLSGTMLVNFVTEYLFCGFVPPFWTPAGEAGRGNWRSGRGRPGLGEGEMVLKS